MRGALQAAQGALEVRRGREGRVPLRVRPVQRASSEEDGNLLAAWAGTPVYPGLAVLPSPSCGFSLPLLSSPRSLVSFTRFLCPSPHLCCHSPPVVLHSRLLFSSGRLLPFTPCVVHDVASLSSPSPCCPPSRHVGSLLAFLCYVWALHSYLLAFLRHVHAFCNYLLAFLRHVGAFHTYELAFLRHVRPFHTYLLASLRHLRAFLIHLLAFLRLLLAFLGHLSAFHSCLLVFAGHVRALVILKLTCVVLDWPISFATALAGVHMF